MRLKLPLTILFVGIAICNAYGITWFNGKQPVTYCIKGKSSPVIEYASKMFEGDIEAVTGMKAERKQRHATIELLLDETLGRDAFRIETKDDHIEIRGGNARGMAYGLLEMSRIAGVSPWIWWGDSHPERQETLTLPDNYKSEQRPSVEFRGIFINDEDWSSRVWNQTIDPSAKAGQMGTRYYRHLFELMLRLRANTLWPAMHEGTEPFFQVAGNRALADSFAIVIGTSHCEPMLRNNVGEWNREVRGEYNFLTNRQEVIGYWNERLKQSIGGEYIYTIGMRGIHDGQMAGVKSLDEHTKALQEVINTQREMLARTLKTNVERVPQMFVPYKEVLQVMENGLNVPDDATLLWCDDNYGYITRLGNLSERRSGGAGIYYHLSYWGRPHDYLWLTTTQPGLIVEQMKTAYEHDARRIWIANVHDPKVAAFDLELFMDLAWNIECVNRADVGKHLEKWLTREFGKEASTLLYPAMRKFYQLCGQRRPEFMGWSQVELDKRRYNRGLSPMQDTEFSHEFGDEISRYLSDYKNIAKTISEAKKNIRPEQRDAFFAAIEYPVCASKNMAIKTLEAQLARHAKDSLAHENHKDASLKAYHEIETLTRRYNDTIAHGKWHGLMSMNPRTLPVFGEPSFEPTSTSSTNTSTKFFISQNANACTTSRPTDMLGHSMSAVPMKMGETLSYDFTTEQEGEAILSVAFVPTHPIDGADLRCSVQIDQNAPITFSLKEPFRSEKWKLNVLRGQALKQANVTLSKGRHTLKITSLDPNIIVDQWMIDFDLNRHFYLIPQRNERDINLK